jgi:hypothetical protein
MFHALSACCTHAEPQNRTANITARKAFYVCAQPPSAAAAMVLNATIGSKLLRTAAPTLIACRGAALRRGEFSSEVV